ncbi:Rv3654c family TadE-like protein [Actinopolymorpha pittospori]
MSVLPHGKKTLAGDGPATPLGDGPERGSGSVWVLAVACLLIMASVAAIAVAAVLGAGRRADTAADLAALSAAGMGPADLDSACAVAERIAAAHRTSLTACTVEGAVVDVTVEARQAMPGGLALTLRARARAGPSSGPVPDQARDEVGP